MVSFLGYYLKCFNHMHSISDFQTPCLTGGSWDTQLPAGGEAGDRGDLQCNNIIILFIYIILILLY